MLKRKLKALGSDEFQMPLVPGETLEKAVYRCLEGVPLGQLKIEEVFQVLLDGEKVPPEKWSERELSEDSFVVVAPIIRGDNEGAVFRQVFVIAATIAASAFFSPGAGAGFAAKFGSALAVAGVSMASTLLIHALIPPPIPRDVGQDGGIGDSQMYSISGQSNGVRRFGGVPRIYGQHRVFPLLAANPYVEIETDPVTGELAQYLYAIYDFGYGPLNLTELKIGDTPISQYDQASFFLVDLNRPATDEGPWDAGVLNDFVFYKGDVEPEALAITLDGNRDAGSPVSEYEAVRTTPVNTDGSETTITVSLVNPQGLYGITNTAAQVQRSIDIEVYFRRVGTLTWRAWNDPTYVKEFFGVGGDSAFQDTAQELLVGTPTSLPYLDTTYTGAPYTYGPRQSNWGESGFAPVYTPKKYGWAAGRTQIVLKDNGDLVAGNRIRYNGLLLGTIASVAEYGPNTAYSIVTLTSGLSAPVHLFEYLVPFYPGIDPLVTVDAAVTGKVYTQKGVLGKGRITRNEQSAAYSTYRFTPRTPGQYEVRVTRVNTFSDVPVSRGIDSMAWVGLRTRFARAPIVTDKRHLFLELRIKATNQLNGAIQNLSAVASSVLDVYNGSSWVKQETSNPAWVFADILTGSANKRPLPKSRLDTASLVEWAEFCDEVPDSPSSLTYTLPRFSCNFVFDYSATVQSLLQQVSSAAQASMAIYDSKYGVLVDKLKTTPVQLFTPRNSRGFSSSRIYSQKPHALKVKFIEPSNGWDAREIVVYDDGYTEANATIFEEMVAFACTNAEQAYRFGRFMLAQNRLRQETIQIEVDFENLICTRGDYVKITQDVMRVGGVPARVKSVTGNRVVIDDAVETIPMTNYGFTFRSITGEIFTNTLTVVSADTFDLDGSDIPEVGDLFVFGEVSQITYDCIVKSIEPGENLRAVLTLVEKADAIYDAESSDTFPPYNPQISTARDPDTVPPGQVRDLEVVANTWRCNGSEYENYVDLSWDVPLDGGTYEQFQVFVDDGRGLTLYETTRNTDLRVIISPSRLDREHTFKVLAVSATGRKLDLFGITGVTATPASKTSPPSDIETLSSNVTNEVLQLTWERPSDCDIDEYLVRYSPDMDAAWEASTPLARASASADSVSVQARTGVYLIKAIDWNGNESANAARAITTIPELTNLNVIEIINDFPTLAGTFDRTELLGSEIILSKAISGGPDEAEFYPEGYYYYANLLDLSEIYSVRLQSLVQAEGYTDGDLMANWTSLAAVPYLASARSPDWDVVTEYRSTDSIVVMSDWDTLSDIDPIGGGSPESWSDWRPFIMGDVTGRIFQFRLKLISNKPSVTPRIFGGQIRADMPDRSEIFNNLTIPVEAPEDGLEVEFDPPFAGPGTSPNLQISIDGAQQGDYHAYVGRSLSGVTVKIFDKDDNPVSRTFDLAVRGYGRKNDAVI